MRVRMHLPRRLRQLSRNHRELCTLVVNDCQSLQKDQLSNVQVMLRCEQSDCIMNTTVT
jgi:hypothetical protein